MTHNVGTLDSVKQASTGKPLARADMTRGRRPRVWTTAALRDLVYAGAVFVWSIVAFTVLVAGVSVTVSLLVLIVGVFVWVGFAYVVRWTTSVDRRLAGWQRHEPIRAVYRRPAARGFVSLLKTVRSDPQTWKNLAWLALTSIAGFTLGLAAITAAGIALAYLSMPIWYWAISDPGAQYGLTNLGLFTVDTFGEAVAATAVGLALAPLALLLARGCATTHAGLAARVLGSPPAAKLAEEHELGRRSDANAAPLGAEQQQAAEAR